MTRAETLLCATIRRVLVGDTGLFIEERANHKRTAGAAMPPDNDAAGCSYVTFRVTTKKSNRGHNQERS